MQNCGQGVTCWLNVDPALVHINYECFKLTSVASVLEKLEWMYLQIYKGIWYIDLCWALCHPELYTYRLQCKIIKNNVPSQLMTSKKRNVERQLLCKLGAESLLK
jgi:hypothetical protein